MTYRCHHCGTTDYPDLDRCFHCGAPVPEDNNLVRPIIYTALAAAVILLGAAGWASEPHRGGGAIIPVEHIEMPDGTKLVPSDTFEVHLRTNGATQWMSTDACACQEIPNES